MKDGKAFSRADGRPMLHRSSLSVRSPTGRADRHLSLHPSEHPRLSADPGHPPCSVAAAAPVPRCRTRRLRHVAARRAAQPAARSVSPANCARTRRSRRATADLDTPPRGDPGAALLCADTQQKCCLPPAPGGLFSALLFWCCLAPTQFSTGQPGVLLGSPAARVSLVSPALFRLSRPVS